MPEPANKRSRRGGKATRCHYSGSMDALVEALSPCIPRPSFIRYLEQMSDELNKGLIIQPLPLDPGGAPSMSQSEFDAANRFEHA